jgi:enamine deaminase RidA (YjgF/YER057c/UK114 family)
MTRHHLFDPEGMAPAVGFSHGALGSGGKVLHVAGQTGHHSDGSIDATLVEQFAQACRSVARVIEEAGGAPDDLLSLTIYTTEVDGYRESLAPIGAAYREVFGRHYPAMALLGVRELFDPEAKVELVAVAQIEG